MSSVDYSVVMTTEVAAALRRHLLQHIRKGQRQEDLCFALWKPSTGKTRTTAVLTEAILPGANERRLHGGASFLPSYLDRGGGGRDVEERRHRTTTQSLHTGMAGDERGGHRHGAKHRTFDTGRDGGCRSWA